MNNNTKDWNCYICNKTIKVTEDYEPEFCCSGNDCCCGGEPTNPVFCDECEEKLKTKKKYFWSFNKSEEVWNCSESTIKDCVEEAQKYNNEIEENRYKFIFIGESINYTPSIDAIEIIEIIQEDAYQECGECCEGWLDIIKKEQKQSLEEKFNKALKEWLEETNNSPCFGKLLNIKCYDLGTRIEVKYE